jgi:hypothetical protein
MMGALRFGIPSPEDPMRRPAAPRFLLASTLFALALALALAPAPSRATTKPHFEGRISVDGFTGEWADDERVFGFNRAMKMLEEPTDDSKWGVNNDISQLRVTWDADTLYLAGDAKTWGNNLIIWVDAVPGRGMTTMTGLNSWARNFTFDTSGVASDGDFAPDLFGATWDNNSTPHLVLHQSGTQVVDYQVGGNLFRAASTFSQDNDGRAMELAIPWSVVFTNDPESRDTVVTVEGRRDTLRWFPPGQRKLKLCAAITAGGDNTGGPDTAPDNTRGHVSDGSAFVYVDDFAEIALDLKDDTGLGHGGPDGIPDWHIGPTSRSETGRFRFKYPVPIVGVRFAVEDLEFDRPAFAPDRGEEIRYRFKVTPPVSPADPLAVAGARTVDVTANVFDLRGHFVRNLSIADRRSALPTASDPYLPSRPDLDRWDGRDSDGHVVPPGIYVLRVVIEPNLSRQTRAMVVVR